MLTLVCLGMTIIGLSRCSPKVPAAVAASEPGAAEKVAEVRRDYTEAQMEEGRLVWQSSCKKCHKLFEPDSRSVEKWERVLPRMSRKAKLDETDAGKVRAYLLAHAKPE